MRGGLGFRVWGLVVGVKVKEAMWRSYTDVWERKRTWKLPCRAEGFKDWDLRRRVQGLGLRVEGLGSRDEDVEQDFKGVGI